MLGAGVQGGRETVCAVTLQLPRLVPPFLDAGRVGMWMVYKGIASILMVEVVFQRMAILNVVIKGLGGVSLYDVSSLTWSPTCQVPHLQYNLEDLGTSVISISKKVRLYLDASKSFKYESQVSSVSTNHFRSSCGDRPSRRCAGNAVDVKMEYR